MEGGNVLIAPSTYFYFNNGTGETRTEGFFGLEQLYVMELFTMRGISGSDIDILPGTTVCHGHSPTPGVNSTSPLRDY